MRVRAEDTRQRKLELDELEARWTRVFNNGVKDAEIRLGGVYGKVLANIRADVEAIKNDQLSMGSSIRQLEADQKTARTAISEDRLTLETHKVELGSGRRAELMRSGASGAVASVLTIVLTIVAKMLGVNLPGSSP